MENLLSFNNDPAIKEALISRMDKHIEMDNLFQRAIGENGKGCTVWCALNNGELKEGYSHASFPTILGLPEWLARLQDVIFEGLDVEDAKWFSSAWPKAIPVGVNLEPVRWKFAVMLMRENIKRVEELKDISDNLKKQVVDAIKGSLALNERAIETGIWDDEAALSAQSALSAAQSALSASLSARSAALSAALSAQSALSASRSARSAALSAALSAQSASRSALSAALSAQSALSAYKRYADELLKLLTEAK